MCLASSLQPPKLFALSCNLIYQHSAQQLYYMHCVEQSAQAAVQCKVHKNCAAHCTVHNNCAVQWKVHKNCAAHCRVCSSGAVGRIITSCQGGLAQPRGSNVSLITAPPQRYCQPAPPCCKNLSAPIVYIEIHSWVVIFTSNTYFTFRSRLLRQKTWSY